MRKRRGIALVAAIGLAAAAACGNGSGAAPETQAPVTSTGDPAPGVALKLRFGRQTERTLDPAADGRATTAVVAGANEFAIDLYRAVAWGADGKDPTRNVVVGPYSVINALGMIYAGARGGTAEEMGAVLHDTLPEGAWHEGLNAYDLALDARTAGSPTEWSHANKVWTQRGLALVGDYLDVLTAQYGSPLAEADFAGRGDDERQVINGWVAERTGQRITGLFPPGTIGADTVLALVNAVALDAPWEFPFNPAVTRDQPFTRLDGSTITVPTMHYDEYLPSAWTPGYQAVEIPYGGGALSMVVIVPEDLVAFESSLTVASLTAVIDAIEPGGIHLSLPKWTARTHQRLNDTLAALGMPSAFRADADFSGMVTGGGLHLAVVEHEAYVEVDEDGTRAAAATGGAMVSSHGPTVDVNRPFLYVIRDRGAGTVLFIGRVTDPSAGA